MSAKLSYVHGAIDTPLIGETIGAAFDRTVARYGDCHALTVQQQGVRWTYRELGERVDAFAAGLLALGFEPGERVAIWAPNCAEWVVTQFATAKAGLILVNINPAYRLAELEYALNKVGVAGIVTATAFRTSDYVGMLNALAPELASAAPGQLRAAKLPHLRHRDPDRRPETRRAWSRSTMSRRWAGTGERARLAELAERLQFDDPINIQFTSGTTGTPKGATLTHHNILNNGFFLGEAMRYSERDKVCIPVPLYHCFGMVIGNLACMTHGAAMVFPGEGFDPLATLQTVAEERCTSLYGVPTMFIAELEHPDFDRFDLSSLRTGMMAGSPCPIEVMRQCIEKMHLTEMTIGYGMTETSPVSTQTAIDDPIEKRVGRRSAGCIRMSRSRSSTPRAASCRAARPANSAPAAIRSCSAIGTIRSARAEAIDRAGWMHTGDLATIDEEGYCNIVGRIKDMVIRGGENVYPREIEEFLYRHPKIQDVQVFGVPDERYGEEICAWVSPARRRAHGGRGDAAPSARARSRITRSRATSDSSRNFR